MFNELKHYVTLYLWTFYNFSAIIFTVITMAEKKNSDAKIRANNKYTAAHYDRINMALPKGSRRLVEYCAKKHGESINRYVCRVVLEAIKADLDSEKMMEQEFFDMF